MFRPTLGQELFRYGVVLGIFFVVYHIITGYYYISQVILLVVGFYCTSLLTNLLKPKDKPRLNINGAILAKDPYGPEANMPEPIINGNLYFDHDTGPPSVEALHQIITPHFLPYPNFSSRLEPGPLGEMYWVPVKVWSIIK